MNSDEIKRLRELAGGMAEVEAVAAAFDHLEATQASHDRLLEAFVGAHEDAAASFDFARMNLPHCDGDCAPEGSCITERCIRCFCAHKVRAHHEAADSAAIDAAKELHDAE